MARKSTAITPYAGNQGPDQIALPQCFQNQWLLSTNQESQNYTSAARASLYIRCSHKD